MTLEEVKHILLNNNWTKKELMELGFQRFGISKSLIKSMNKADAIRKIESAHGNERTLDVISEMARRVGRERRN